MTKLVAFTFDITPEVCADVLCAVVPFNVVNIYIAHNWSDLSVSNLNGLIKYCTLASRVRVEWTTERRTIF